MKEYEPCSVLLLRQISCALAPLGSATQMAQGLGRSGSMKYPVGVSRGTAGCRTKAMCLPSSDQTASESQSTDGATYLTDFLFRVINANETVVPAPGINQQALAVRRPAERRIAAANDELHGLILARRARHPHLAALFIRDDSHRRNLRFTARVDFSRHGCVPGNDPHVLLRAPRIAGGIRILAGGIFSHTADVDNTRAAGKKFQFGEFAPVILRVIRQLARGERRPFSNPDVPAAPLDLRPGQAVSRLQGRHVAEERSRKDLLQRERLLRVRGAHEKDGKEQGADRDAEKFAVQGNPPNTKLLFLPAFRPGCGSSRYRSDRRLHGTRQDKFARRHRRFGLALGSGFTRKIQG